MSYLKLDVMFSGSDHITFSSCDCISFPLSVKGGVLLKTEDTMENASVNSLYEKVNSLWSSTYSACYDDVNHVIQTFFLRSSC